MGDLLSHCTTQLLRLERGTSSSDSDLVIIGNKEKKERKNQNNHEKFH
jgi:hypothetical protein